MLKQPLKVWKLLFQRRHWKESHFQCYVDLRSGSVHFTQCVTCSLSRNVHYVLCHYENGTKDRQEAGGKTYRLQILL
jgi:hypothetical protein